MHRPVHGPSPSSGRRVALLAIVSVALIALSVRADDPASPDPFEQARAVVKSIRDAGEFAHRSDAAILADLESAGHFAGESGADVRARIERYLSKARVAKAVEPPSSRDDGAAARSGEVETAAASRSPREAEPNDSIATAHPIPNGASLRGSAASEGDVDFYSFAVADGDTLRATLDGDGDGVLRLYDAGGVEVASARCDGTGAGSLLVAALDAGVHAISVEEDGRDARFDYVLTLVCATSVEPNSTTPGSIASPGETDRYALTIHADSFVTLYASGNGDGELTVTDENGTRVGHGDDGPGLSPVVRLHLGAGTYFVAVNEAGRDATMSYALTADVVSPTGDEIEPNDDATNATSIGCGETRSGRIAPGGDLDVWSVHVVQRTAVEVFVSDRGLDARRAARLRAYDAEMALLDTQVETTAGSGGLFANLILEPRVRFLALDDATGLDGFAYAVRVNCEFGVAGGDPESEPNDSAETADTLACGQSRCGNVEVPAGRDPGGADWYVFSLPSRKRVRLVLDIGPGSHLDDPILVLHTTDANGLPRKLRIDDDTYRASPVIDMPLPQGTYYVQVSAFQQYGSGADYTLRLTCEDLAITDLGRIENGHTISGTIATPGGAAMATYYARPGDRLRVIARSSVLDPTILLETPAGEFLDYDDDDAEGTGAQVCALASLSGPYTLLVGDVADGTGALTVSLDLDPATNGSEIEPNNTRSSANVIQHGTHWNAETSIVTFSDIEYYKFSASSGDTVTVEARKCTDLNIDRDPHDLELTVYDTQLNVIEAGADQGEGTDPYVQVVLPPATADYYVKVWVKGSLFEPKRTKYRLFFNFDQIPFSFAPNVPCVVPSGSPITATITASNPSTIKKTLTMTIDRIPEGGVATRLVNRTAKAPGGFQRTKAVNLGAAPAVAAPTRFRYLATITVGSTSVPVDFDVLVTP